MKKTLIILTTLLFSCNFTAFSQVIVEFETITEALNYNGDRDAVKKLIITGEIAGDDYSPTSEWSKFRTLDETFPNIEEVEILTSQDIPDYDTINYCALFYWEEYDNGVYIGNSGANWLKSFSAPNIKSIGNNAFRYCYNLFSVNFPIVETLRSNAFRDCHNLISVDFSMATTIEGAAFAGCLSLTSVNFPLVKTIRNYVFAYCNSLIYINFPLVTTIEDYAFYSCENLTSVNFPLVKTIGKEAFWFCDNLISANLPNVTIIEANAFSYCFSLISADFPLVTTIGYAAFRKCYDLVSVNIPLLKTVRNLTFDECISLTSINFPLVTTIGHGAFNDCFSLTSADFPILTTIMEAAFYACTNLTSIDFPVIMTIGSSAFSECKSLASVSFGTGFSEPTTINFGVCTFGCGDSLTPNIDLTLGEYVLPKPDLTANIWRSNYWDEINRRDYIWKSINLKTNSIEEKEEKITDIFCIDQNIYYIYNSSELELYDVMGRLIRNYSNEIIIDLNGLNAGVYFLKYFKNFKVEIQKILVY